MIDVGPKINQSLYSREAYLTLSNCVCTSSECAAKRVTLPFMKMKRCWLANEKTLLLQHLEFYWPERKGTFP